MSWTIMAWLGKGELIRNPCKECDYYHSTNNTCQSKKCCTGGAGYVTIFDRLFCKPYKAEEEWKKYKGAIRKEE